jgi:hypothetical protein
MGYTDRDTQWPWFDFKSGSFDFILGGIFPALVGAALAIPFFVILGKIRDRFFKNVSLLDGVREMNAVFKNSIHRQVTATVITELQDKKNADYNRDNIKDRRGDKVKIVVTKLSDGNPHYVIDSGRDILIHDHDYFVLSRNRQGTSLFTVVQRGDQAVREKVLTLTEGEGLDHITPTQEDIIVMASKAGGVRSMYTIDRKDPKKVSHYLLGISPSVEPIVGMSANGEEKLYLISMFLIGREEAGVFRITVFKPDSEEPFQDISLPQELEEYGYRWTEDYLDEGHRIAIFASLETTKRMEGLFLWF